MLVQNQKIAMQWSSRNKKYYMELGYMYTKMKDIFYVNPIELPYGSKKKVKVICDNCKIERLIEWRDYLTQHNDNYGDLCKKCVNIKTKNTCMEKYGKSNPSQVELFKQKRKETHIKIYGVENAFQSDEIKEKIKYSNMKKYGVEYVAQNKEIKKKIQNTNFKKYGVKAPCQNKNIENKVIKTCLEKYGVPYTCQADEVRVKINKTLCKNGNVKTSQQQSSIYNLLKEIYGDNNVFLNYPVDKIALDCMLNYKDNKIDIEYDGVFWHKNKKKKDAQRNYFLMTKGYKIIRILGNYEIPNKEQLKQTIDCLVKGKQKLIRINMDI